MNPKIRPMSFLVFLIAGSLGWLVGRPGSGEITESKDPEVVARVRPDDTAARKMDGIHEKLSRIRAEATREDRARAVLAIAKGLSDEELKEWLDRGWIDKLGDPEAMVFNRIAEDRWLADDPRGLVAFLSERDIDRAGRIAGRWALEDPEEVSRFLIEARHSDGTKGLLHGALKGMAAADPLRALTTIAAFESVLSDSDAWSLTSAFEALAERDPDVLREAMAQWRFGLKIQADIALAQVAIENDLESGLAALADRDDGFDMLGRLMGRNDLGARIIASADLLPEGWLSRMVATNSRMSYQTANAWMALDFSRYGVEEKAGEKLRIWALQTLAHSDPTVFVAKLATDDFSPEERKTIISMTINASSWKADPSITDELMGTLSDPEELELARQEIDEVRSQKDAYHRTRTPEEWITNLSESEHTNGSSYWDVRWDAEQVASALRTLEGMGHSEKLATARKITDSGFASYADPLIRGEAIRYCLVAKDSPEGETGPGFMLTTNAVQLAHSWTELDPKAASAWASSLPEGEVRQWVIKNVSATWAHYNPDAAAAWVRTLPEGK